jgi:hypothetical protein
MAKAVEMNRKLDGDPNFKASSISLSVAMAFGN